MPTGSLCAERNVIGTALAADPGLKREDLLMVAVLAIQLPEDPPKHPLRSPPPGPQFCSPVNALDGDGKKFILEVEEQLKQCQQSEGIRRSLSKSSFASIVECKSENVPDDDHDEWEMEIFPSSLDGGGSADAALTAQQQSASSSFKATESALPELNLAKVGRDGLTTTTCASQTSGQSTPKRRIALYKIADDNGASCVDNERSRIKSPNERKVKMGGGVKKQRRTVLVQASADINPLKPCGACNEWLKKIAESNPYFKVLTFTDSKCNGVYVSPCQE